MATNEFGWNEQILLMQFNAALRNGWIPYFREFGNQYDIPAGRLMSIASRETNMKNIRGDYSRRPGEKFKRYHGFGIMQVDINTDPAWCAKWHVTKVRESILRGTQILKSKYNYLANRGLKRETLDRYAIAAYNGGEGRAFSAFLRSDTPDSITTKKNYASDVLAREVYFNKFLATI